MSDRHGIEIDYCPQCRGVWLDRGELDKIIERAAALETSPVAPQPSAPQTPAPQYPAPQYPAAPGYGHQDPYYPRKKRKSWLEEIFD